MLVVLLAQVLPTSDAAAVALTSRGMLMATDGVFAAVSGAAAARRTTTSRS